MTGPPKPLSPGASTGYGDAEGTKKAELCHDGRKPDSSGCHGPWMQQERGAAPRDERPDEISKRPPPPLVAAELWQRMHESTHKRSTSIRVLDF